MQKIPGVGARLPDWFCKILSLLVVVGMVKVLVDIITNNVLDVIAASSRYQENLMHLFNNVDQHYRIKVLAGFDGFLKNLSVQKILVNIYGVFTTLTSSAVLIALYVVFLFVEQHFFKQKMNALFPQAGHRQVADSIITHILKDTQTYLGSVGFNSLLHKIMGAYVCNYAVTYIFLQVSTSRWVYRHSSVSSCANWRIYGL